MRPTPQRPVIVALISLALIGVGFCMGGCGRTENQLSTGRVLTPSDLPGDLHGDTAYAEVRADALPLIYGDMQDAANRLGVVRWDARWDCNGFAGLYIGTARVRYATAAWHLETPAQSLALAEVWYRRDDTGRMHAIVLAATDRGSRYVEPQTGRVVTLSEAELKSRRLVKW